MTSFTALPPGISTDLTPTGVEGGQEHPWKLSAHTKYYTSVFIIKDGQILLGRKKRGFGLDYYLGFGGKVEPGETSEQAALRELQEEAGVSADLIHAGVLLFTKEGIDWTFHIDIYRAEHYTGSIIETEEMHPQWFAIDDIPYDKMWGSDRYWLPFVISNEYFMGRTDFLANDALQKWWFGVRSNKMRSS